MVGCSLFATTAQLWAVTEPKGLSSRLLREGLGGLFLRSFPAINFWDSNVSSHQRVRSWDGFRVENEGVSVDKENGREEVVLED